MGLLSRLGLMKRAEHEAFVQVAGNALQNSEDDLKASKKEKQALYVELAKAGNLRGELKARAEKAEELLERALARESTLRPDAEKYRAKLERDRNRPSRAKGKG